MSNSLRALTFAASVLVPAVASMAAVTVGNFGAPGAAWPTSPDSTSSQAINPTITAGQVPNAGTVNQTIGTNTVIGQTFTVTSPFTLGSIGWVGTGGANLNLGIHLYKFNTGSAYNPATSGGYVPASDLGPDLLGAGSGATATYAGSTSDNVLFFDMSGADQVALTAGVYAFEVWNLSGATGNLFLKRAGETYTGGSVFQVTDPAAQSSTSSVSRNNVAGGTRDGTFAVYAAAVPEPTTLTALAAVGAIAIKRRRR